MLEAAERSFLARGYGATTVASIAEAARVRPRIAIVSAAVAVGLGALGAVAVWSAFAILLPTVAVDAFDIGLGLLAMLAVAVSGVADLVQQPVVPLSLVAALAIATAHELRERVSHVNAS